MRVRSSDACLWNILVAEEDIPKTGVTRLDLRACRIGALTLAKVADQCIWCYMSAQPTAGVTNNSAVHLELSAQHRRAQKECKPYSNRRHFVTTGSNKQRHSHVMQRQATSNELAH
jgi:hypothetical protein